MRKKLFTLLLALAASLGTMFASTKIGDLYYDLDASDKTAEVARNNSASGDIVIPASVTYNSVTYSVTSIESYAFKSCTGLTSVNIPESVTIIGGGAFSGCTGLMSVNIPESVTSIGGDAFANCVSLPVIDNFRWAGDSYIVEVIDKTFTNYQIPSNTKWIGGGAFSKCKNMTSLSLPEGLLSIESIAFQGCDNLTSVTIPSSLKQIGQYAFDKCKKLTFVQWNAKSCSFYELGWRYGYAGTTPWGNYDGEGISTIILGDDVENIPDYLCAETNINSIIIPKNVRSIGLNVFNACKSLTSVTWNAIHCNNMGGKISVFNDRSSQITSFTIGNQVKVIPAYLCYGMSAVPSFTIPCSVDSIGLNAFYGCAVVFRDCGKTIHNFEEATLCTAFDVNNLPKWVKDSVAVGEPISSWKSYSGEYIQYTCNSTFDSVINTFAVITGHTDSIQLPDTILCHRGAEICDSKGHCQVFESSGVFACIYENTYGCDSVVSRNVIVKQDTTYLPDTLICSGESISDGKISQPFYESGVYNYTYINSEGCDSVISRNIYVVQHVVTPTINVKSAFDTPNSGRITISKNTSGTPASFAYFTINGIKHNRSSDNIGTGYSVNNLAEGTYRMVFYSILDCDSIVKNITINQYGMKVNGMYYLLDETNHTATLTYRGSSYDNYNGEYSGNITIPKTITFEGIEYQVTGINSSTFSGCSNISTITMEAETPISMYNSGLSNNCIIYVPYGSLNAYKSASGWRNYTIHVINSSHATTTTGATSATITLGNTNEAQHIASCGMEGGAEEFAGNVIEYIGLEPNSEYANIPLFIKTKEGDLDNTTVSFTTTALELTTKASKPVAATTALLFAETNMADAEISCGFEWKRNDAPADMEGNKVFCPVASGQMAGRLKNLKDDVYYKYRAFYQSAAGKMYYGDWQYIFTGDVTVEFDPVLYTYGATVVHEKDATISGYALAGSEDFTEQGFEYWSESRANGGANAPHRTPAALGEHFFVQASGIALRVTLTNLDAGTVYKYRVYGKVGDQYYYGAEQSFTTQGEYEGDDSETIEEVPSDQVPSAKAQKVLRNGQISILRGDKVYTVTGQEVK